MPFEKQALSPHALRILTGTAAGTVAGAAGGRYLTDADDENRTRNTVLGGLAGGVLGGLGGQGYHMYRGRPGQIPRAAIGGSSRSRAATGGSSRSRAEAPSDIRAGKPDSSVRAEDFVGAPRLPSDVSPRGLPGGHASPGLPGGHAPPGLPGGHAPPGLPGGHAPPGLPGGHAPPGLPEPTRFGAGSLEPVRPRPSILDDSPDLSWGPDQHFSREDTAYLRRQAQGELEQAKRHGFNPEGVSGANVLGAAKLFQQTGDQRTLRNYPFARRMVKGAEFLDVEDQARLAVFEHFGLSKLGMELLFNR